MKLRTFTNAIVVLGLSLLCGLPRTASARNADWDFIRIQVRRQQVEVKSRAGAFTATFQNEAIVHPTGRATGALSLTAPGGAPLRFHVVAGRVRFGDGAVTEVRLLLRKAGAEPGDDFDIAVVRPDPAPGQDCLIYDFVGPNVHGGAVRFEAQGRIEVVHF
jgi:hypothetical protein